MANRIIIGADERKIEDIEPNWIAEQIVRRKRDGVPVCVIVKLDSDGLNLTLASGGCSGGSGGGSWQPSRQQQHVIDLWKKHQLNESDINPGNLIAFLKKVCR